MKWSEIEGCIEEIKELTRCDREIAIKIFHLVANWTGGNIPDDEDLPSNR